MALSATSPFTLTQGDSTFRVHQKRAGEAVAIDTDKNQVLDDKEIVDYLEKKGDLAATCRARTTTIAASSANISNTSKGSCPRASTLINLTPN